MLTRIRIILIVLVLILFFAVGAFCQSTVQLTLDQANQLVADKRISEAITLLTLEINKEPKNNYLLLARARCYRSAGDYNSAANDLKTVTSLFAYAEQRENSLMAFSRDGSPKENSQIFDLLIGADPANSAAYRMRAVQKLADKEYERALDDTLKGAGVEPTAASERLGLPSSALDGLKNEKNIFELYERVFSVYEGILRDLQSKVAEMPPGYAVRGKLEMVGAAQQIGVFLHGLSIARAELALEKRKNEEAERSLDHMTQIEPQVMAYRFRIEYYKKHGRSKDAEQDEINLFDATIKYETSLIEDEIFVSSKAYNLMSRGDTYLNAKQYDNAIADYESAIRLYAAIESKVLPKIAEAKQKQKEAMAPPK